MKHILTILFLNVLIGALIEPAFGQQDWINYKADAVLSFTVTVPGEMDFESKEITTAIGKLTTQTYSYKGGDEDPNYLYLINLVEYPTGVFPADSTQLIDDYLKNSIQSTTEKVNGELIYSSDIDDESNGFGKLYRIKHNNDQLILKGKSFLRKDVFINVQVFTFKNQSLNEEMNYFLDSFTAKF